MFQTLHFFSIEFNVKTLLKFRTCVRLPTTYSVPTTQWQPPNNLPTAYWRPTNNLLTTSLQPTCTSNLAANNLLTTYTDNLLTTYMYQQPSCRQPTADSDLLITYLLKHCNFHNLIHVYLSSSGCHDIVIKWNYLVGNNSYLTINLDSLVQMVQSAV